MVPEYFLNGAPPDTINFNDLKNSEQRRKKKQNSLKSLKIQKSFEISKDPKPSNMPDSKLDNEILTVEVLGFVF